MTTDQTTSPPAPPEPTSTSTYQEWDLWLRHKAREATDAQTVAINAQVTAMAAMHETQKETLELLRESAPPAPAPPPPIPTTTAPR